MITLQCGAQCAGKLKPQVNHHFLAGSSLGIATVGKERSHYEIPYYLPPQISRRWWQTGGRTGPIEIN